MEELVLGIGLIIIASLLYILKKVSDKNRKKMMDEIENND